MTRISSALSLVVEGNVHKKENVRALRERFVRLFNAIAIISPTTKCADYVSLIKPPAANPPHIPIVVALILIRLYSAIVVPVANLVEGSYFAVIASRIPPPVIRTGLGDSSRMSGCVSCNIISCSGFEESRAVSDIDDILSVVEISLAKWGL